MHDLPRLRWGPLHDPRYCQDPGKPFSQRQPREEIHMAKKAQTMEVADVFVPAHWPRRERRPQVTGVRRRTLGRPALPAFVRATKSLDAALEGLSDVATWEDQMARFGYCNSGQVIDRALTQVREIQALLARLETQLLEGAE